MNRLAAPWQLIRIATRAAESDDTARIAETPYAAAVTIVLGEAENMVAELRAEIKAGRPVVSMLKNIHDTARELRSEINLSFDSPWSRQLAAIRNDVSALLKSEIETTPGSVQAPAAPAPGQGHRARLAARSARRRRRPRRGSNSSAPAATTPASSRSAK